MQAIRCHCSLLCLAGFSLGAGGCGPARLDGDAAMGSYFRVLPAAAAEQTLTVCPAGTTIPGIDVSKWNGTVNWSQVAAAGTGFVFIRVSDGLGYPDGTFATNWAEAKVHGIARGAYQLFRSDENPVDEADYLINTMGPLERYDLPPVIDVETADGQSPVTIATNVGTWIGHVESALGVTPIIYTNTSFWLASVGSSTFADHPLWIANWDVTCPNLPTPWTNWQFWQHSSTGTVSGISGNVDLDWFNGDAAALQAFGVQPPLGGDDAAAVDSGSPSDPGPIESDTPEKNDPSRPGDRDESRVGAAEVSGGCACRSAGSIEDSLMLAFLALANRRRARLRGSWMQARLRVGRCTWPPHGSLLAQHFPQAGGEETGGDCHRS